jgi:pilus assembly protein Flp/PilA
MFATDMTEARWLSRAGSRPFTAVADWEPRIARIGMGLGVAIRTIRAYIAVTRRHRRDTESEENLVIGLYQRLVTGLRSAYANEEGQGLTEYGLILVLIAIVVILMLGVLGHQVGNQYNSVQHSLP